MYAPLTCPLLFGCLRRQSIGEDVRDDLIAKHIPESDFYPDDEVSEEVVYWCRYESLIGERRETRTSSDPTKSPEIRRLTQAG